MVAAISGYAVAGGLELALLCDLRVMEDTAVLGLYGRRFGKFKERSTTCWTIFYLNNNSEGNWMNKLLMKVLYIDEMYKYIIYCQINTLRFSNGMSFSK